MLFSELACIQIDEYYTYSLKNVIIRCSVLITLWSMQMGALNRDRNLEKYETIGLAQTTLSAW